LEGFGKAVALLAPEFRRLGRVASLVRFGSLVVQEVPNVEGFDQDAVFKSEDFKDR